MCKTEVHYKDAQVDHRKPVVPNDGTFDWNRPNWTVLINRMFAFGGWQMLCIKCHEAKSIKENALRTVPGSKPKRRRGQGNDEAA